MTKTKKQDKVIDADILRRKKILQKKSKVLRKTKYMNKKYKSDKDFEKKQSNLDNNLRQKNEKKCCVHYH